MPNDTQPSRKTRDDESNSSRRRFANGKGASTSDSGTTDSSGLRRSTRETASKKQISSSPSSAWKSGTSSPLSTRKSERLEKRTLTIAPVKKKFAAFNNQQMISHLRRSERGRNLPSSSSSGSKKSEKMLVLLDLKRKDEKRDKSVKPLLFQAREASRNEKHDQESLGRKRKRLDARTYKALFKMQRRRSNALDADEDPKRLDKLPRVDSIDGGVSASKRMEDSESDGGEECCAKIGQELKEQFSGGDSHDDLGRSYSDIKNSITEIFQDHAEVEIELSRSSQKHDNARTPSEHYDENHIKSSKRGQTVSKILVDTERVPVEEQQQVLALAGSTSIARSLDSDLVPENVGRARRQRGELEADVATRLADGCDGGTQLKEIPVDTQLERDEKICVICNLGGNLMYCDGKGCGRGYHHSCLDPSVDEVPMGDWYCLRCMKKKIELGVHSVSKGIERIWDAREVAVSDAEGLRREKQYFVKYKGLAHIHNQWVSESQLCLEVPLLVAKFDKKNQVVKWNSEWTVPYRLLKKRSLIPLKQPHESNSGHAADRTACLYEWLVKWRGLDYEHATWELENTSFLHSGEGQILIREYQSRREKAKRARFSVDKSKMDSRVKLSKLPDGIPSGIDSKHLSTINVLREYWNKGQSALIIDDLDRVIKVILFILSMSEDCRPFLIVTTSRALSFWEAEFMRLAPAIDLLVYSGNRDTRKSIRALEFYEESGCIMFQVLLCLPEGVIEDLDMLETLRWEAVIVDECQQSRISTCLEQIKRLATDVRVLLFSGQIKDSVAEYLNLLSLLDSDGDLDKGYGSKTEFNDNLGKLKEKLSKFIACDCKSDYSRFVEYWVPVPISNVQLELYCSILLSNSISLCSKSDPVGALRDVLISTRKSCDHPYIVDPSMQALLTKDLPAKEYLNVGIKASGKLQLLDVMLSEMKKRQLRVLILFQSIGDSIKDSIGDILDDYLRQRFGSGSYERVDGSAVVPSQKKQAALTNFNKKENGRFVCLLEIRGCLPSIKLASVDSIVIFGGDWNPVNDLRALYRISVDSQFEKIKIFRLYSACTVEEKILIMKQYLTLDSNSPNISRSTSDALLMWGAAYLFGKLDEFHWDSNLASNANISSDESLLNDVVKEFLALLPSNDKGNVTSKSIIVEVQHNGGTYSRNLPLLGERKIQFADGEQPHIFWTKLLEGRCPLWKYLSVPTQRHRKRVQYFEDLPKKPTGKIVEVEKKRKKLVTNSVDPASAKVGLEEGSIIDEQHMNHVSKPLFSNDNSISPEVHMVESEERRASPDGQNSLHLILKPDIMKLSEILGLSEDVRVMVRRFLEYVIKNHHVNREPATILQAFQISVCWIAASLLKQKIDRRKSLTRAKKFLNFSCDEEEADCVYSKLRPLKKMFLLCSENIKDSDSAKYSMPMSVNNANEAQDARMSKSAACNLQSVKVEIEERSQNLEFTNEPILSQKEASQYNMAGEEVAKSIRRVQRKCEKRMIKLNRKQQEEIEEFHRVWEEKRKQLEKEQRLELALVRSIHSSSPVRMDKLKLLDNEFAKKMDNYKLQKDIYLKDLETKQLTARDEERYKAANWVAEVQSCAGRDMLPLHGSDSRNEMRQCQDIEHRPHSGTEEVGPTSGCLVDGQCLENVQCMPESVVRPSDITETFPSESVDCSIRGEPLSVPVNLRPEYEAASMASTVGVGTSVGTSEGIFSASPPPSEQILDKLISTDQNGDALSRLPEVILSEDVGAHRLEIGSRTEKSIRENNSKDVNSSHIPNAVGDQSDAADVSCNGGLPSTEPSLLRLPAIQPSVSPAQDGLLPQNPVLLVEGSSLTSSEMRDEDAAVQDNQPSQLQDEFPSLQSVDVQPNDHSNPEAPSVENHEQLQPPQPPSFPLCRNHTVTDSASELVLQPQSEVNANASLRNCETAPLLVEDLAELSDQTAVRTRVNLQSRSPSEATELPFGHNGPGLGSFSRVEHQQNGESSTSFLNNGNPPLVVDNSTDLLNYAVLQPGGSVPIVQASNNPPLVVEHQQNGESSASFLNNGNRPVVVDSSADLLNHAVLQPGGSVPIVQASNNPPMHTPNQVTFRMPTVPLYADPLQNELERIRKETEQAIKAHEDTKLRLKSDCDKEIEEIIAQINRKYEAKLHEIEAIFLLKKNELDLNHNKVLMNKILAESFRSKCLDLRPSGSMGMRQAVPSGNPQQLHQLSLQHTLRPSPAAGSYLVGQPAANQQITMPHTQVQNSAAVLSSTVMRPPQISPITPSTGSLRVGGEIRAPAPHIRPFRPAASTPAASIPSLPHGMPSHQAPTNLPRTSSSLTLPPMYHSSPYSRPPQSEIADGLLASRSSSLSAMELLMDIDNRANAHRLNPLPPLPNLAANFDSLDLSEFGPSASAQSRTSSSLTLVTDFVCLSDDD